MNFGFWEIMYFTKILCLIPETHYKKSRGQGHVLLFHRIFPSIWEVKTLVVEVLKVEFFAILARCRL